MTKKKQQETSNKLVSREILEQIKACRPVRLFIRKQKKKGNDGQPFALRSKFLQLPKEKQGKYFQKAADKYLELMDEKQISEHVQIESKLFDIVLSKKEQRQYFDSINAPTKPVHTAGAYYSEIKKQENDFNPKPWKTLTAEERKPYIKMHDEVKNDFNAQVKNFAQDLPERLKIEYLAFVNQTNSATHTHDNHEENASPAPIAQRRKSVQPLPENFQSLPNDSQQKLTRAQLEDLHKCKPDVLYYGKKIPDDEKPTFNNATSKNTYIRSLFKELSDKKRHKFIIKSTKKWEEYLQSHPSVVENQIPTIHLLLGKQEDILYYFTTLGLPPRPPVSAPYLFNHEKEGRNSQQYWNDLPQTTKDEYIKRLAQIKHEYHQQLVDFVEKTLPSDYMRIEFFRNVKYATKDYETSTKDRVHEQDDGQLKITQYLVKKKQPELNKTNEFDRIKQELLSTKLTSEQKKLVERLGEIMNKYFDETTVQKKNSTTSKISTDASNANNEPILHSSPSKQHSHKSDDIIITNGDIASDDAEHVEEVARKKKKKHKRDRSEFEEHDTTNVYNVSSAPTKKRK